MHGRPGWLIAWLSLWAALLALLAVGPALWLVLVAFQPATAELNDPFGGFTLRNFVGAWSEGAGMAMPLLNSVIVTAIRAALNVLLAALAAYPLARMRFKGRQLIFIIILATMMLPAQVIVVPGGDNVVRILPPLNISLEEVDEGLKRLERAASALEAPA